MTLDLNLLRAYEAMLLHRNVTAAAAHVGLTQSAMSNALGRLRQYFDDPLFVKTRAGMVPTPYALELARPLKQALALVRSSTQKRKGFDPSQSRRVFRFYMSDVGEMVFLPALMKRLVRIGENVRVETEQLPSNEVAQRLATGEIDFAAGFFPGLGKSVERAALFPEHYVCMVRRDHPACVNGTMPLAEFRNGSHVLIESMGSGHQVIERTLERNGIRRNIALRVPHFMVIPQIVADTDLIVTIPNQVARLFSEYEKVRVLPLPVSIASFDVSLYWHARFSEEPAIQWMRALMVELFQERRRARAARQ